MNNEKKDNCSKYSPAVRIYVSEWLEHKIWCFYLKKRVNNVFIFLFLLVQLKSFSVLSAFFIFVYFKFKRK